MPRIRADVVKLATPIFIEQVLVHLLGVVTAIMAARLGTDAVSAIGLVESISGVVVSVLGALGIGATVVVAQLTGRGTPRAAAAAMHQAVATGTVIAVGIAVAVVAAREPLLGLLFPDSEPEVSRLMATYLPLAALSYPFAAFTLIACGALRGAGETRSTLHVNVLVNLVHVVLSYVLIYGVKFESRWGSLATPGFGVAGAAMALTASRACGVAYLLISLLPRQRVLPLQGWRHFRVDLVLQRSLFSIGFPASIESLVFNGGKLLVQVMLVGMGTVAIASNHIAFSIANLINIPGSALAVALTTLVGQDAGRRDFEAARRTMWHVLRVGWACMFCAGAVSFAFGPYAVSLYSQDPAVIDTGGLLVRMNCAFLICYPTTFILPYGLMGVGDVRYTLFTTVMGMVVFRLMLGYYLGVTLGFGVVGVWCGVIVDWFVRSSLYLVRLRGDRWQRSLPSL